jgi:hypothetical protein
MMINFIDTNFEVSGKVNKTSLDLVMKVTKEKHFNTRLLPATFPVLTENLPSIFNCQCFNDANKNFVDESKSTEIGHLFEHIMLEYLCMGKLENGHTDAVYEGTTNWNWEKDPIGTFYIKIKVGFEDLLIIRSAFDKTVCLLNKILIN